MPLINAQLSLIQDMKAALGRGVTNADIDAILQSATSAGLTPAEIAEAAQTAGAPVAVNDITSMLSDRNLPVNVVEDPNFPTTENPVSADSPFEMIVTGNTSGTSGFDPGAIVVDPVGTGGVVDLSGGGSGVSSSTSPAISVDDINEAKESPTAITREQYDDALKRMGDIQRHPHMSAEQKREAIAAIAQSLGVPVDASTVSLTGSSDQYGLLSDRFVISENTNNSAGGGSINIPNQGGIEVGGGAPSGGSTPGVVDTPTDIVTDTEHPWVFDADTGTMTNASTGDVVPIPADQRGLFEDGGQYSAGENNEIFDSQGTQVASGSVERDADGNILNVLITGVGGSGDNTNTGGGAGSNNSDGSTGVGTGSTGTGGGAGGSGAGGGSTGGSGGSTGGGGSGGGSGGGTGSGDGAGSGTDVTNNVAVVQAAETPIVDGMFADFVPTFKRQIARNLLNPTFRG